MQFTTLANHSYGVALNAIHSYGVGFDAIHSYGVALDAILKCFIGGLKLEIKRRCLIPKPHVISMSYVIS